MKQWRKDLDPSEQILFDELKKDGRLKIIYGARSILCNGNHWIPDISPSIADKDDLKLDESWFSEKGKANLHRIKWSKTPLPLKNEKSEDEPENEDEDEREEREYQENEDDEYIDEEFFF
jgi:hypothetical protein